MLSRERSLRRRRRHGAPPPLSARSSRRTAFPARSRRLPTPAHGVRGSRSSVPLPLRGRGQVRAPASPRAPRVSDRSGGSRTRRPRPRRPAERAPHGQAAASRFERVARAPAARGLDGAVRDHERSALHRRDRVLAVRRDSAAVVARGREPASAQREHDEDETRRSTDAGPAHGTPHDGGGKSPGVGVTNTSSSSVRPSASVSVAWTRVRTPTAQPGLPRISGQPR